MDKARPPLNPIHASPCNPCKKFKDDQPKLAPSHPWPFPPTLISMEQWTPASPCPGRLHALKERLQVESTSACNVHLGTAQQQWTPQPNSGRKEGRTQNMLTGTPPSHTRGMKGAPTWNLGTEPQWGGGWMNKLGAPVLVTRGKDSTQLRSFRETHWGRGRMLAWPRPG